MRGKMAFLVCSVILGWIPQSVFAAAVAPATIDIDAKPGSAETHTFAVINSGNAEQTYRFTARDFLASDGSDVPLFPSQPLQEDGLADWIKFPVPEITVPARTSVDVPFVVLVPETAAGGTTHAAITATDVIKSDPSVHENVVINTSSAILVFVTVTGERTESLILSSWGLDGSAPGEWVDSLSGVVSFRARNTGNVVVVPEVHVTIKNLLGHVIVEEQLNKEGGRVLPGNERRFEKTIDSIPTGFAESLGWRVRNFVIGPVSLVLSVRYGDGQTLRDQRTVWVWPWQVGAASLGIIAVLLLFIRAVKRLYKRTSQTS
jgi:hypothetical protein